MEAPFGWVETWHLNINDGDGVVSRDYQVKAEAVALVSILADAFPYASIALERRFVPREAPDQPFGD